MVALNESQRIHDDQHVVVTGEVLERPPLVNREEEPKKNIEPPLKVNKRFRGQNLAERRP